MACSRKTRNRRLEGGYHQFWADRDGAHYGSEWNLGLFKAFKTDYGKVALGVQYADYDADRFSSDTQKPWVTVQLQAARKPLRDYLEALLFRKSSDLSL